MLLFPALLDSATIIIRNLVYREASDIDSRQSVILGGLFGITRSAQCDVLHPPSVEYAEAMVFAVREINRDSSLLPRVNLTFDIRETCLNPNCALERSIEFVQPSTLSRSTNQTTTSGIIGPTLSSESDLVARLFNLFQVPQISYGSTAATLSDKSKFEYFFRTIPNDALQAKVMADLIVHFNWTYIYALHSQDTYGREGIDSLITILESKNDSLRCIAMRIILPIGSSDNRTYDNIVESMSQVWVRNASVAVLFGHPGQATEMMRAIMRVDDITTRTILEDITWIASDSWSQRLPVELHKRVKGMIGISPQPGSTEDFIKYFVSLNPENNKTNNPWFNDYWKVVFNCENNPCNVSAQNLSTMPFTGSYIPNVIDAVYAFAHAIHNMIEDHCQDGMICNAIITQRSVGEAIDGDLLRKYLFNVSLSDEKLFDINGDVQGTYSIVNLQFINNSEYSFEVVGEWDDINRLQLTAPVQWPDGGTKPPQSVCSLPCEVGHEQHRLPGQESCCWECKACLGENSVSSGEQCFECGDKQMPNPERSSCVEIPLTYFTASSPWAIVILFLSSAGIAATIFVAVIFAVFSKNKVIKATSRELSAIFIAGVLLCYFLPFLFVVRPSPALCGVRRFVVGFCFAISYSALLVRSNRIHRIFNHPLSKGSVPPRFMGPGSQVIITCLLISVQVVIGVVWLAAEPPSVEAVQVNTRTLELQCGESPYFGVLVSIFYNLLLLLFSTYFAFQTRKVMENFNEAKFINMTVYSLCFIWLGFIPAYFISIQFGTVYKNFFLLLAVILSAFTTLLCLLLPKVFIVLWNIPKKKNLTRDCATSVVYIETTKTI